MHWKRVALEHSDASRQTPTHVIVEEQSVQLGWDLVIGGEGMIGAELRRRLNRKGARLASTTRRPTTPPGTWYHLDLGADPASWQLPKQISSAYLCSAVTSVDRCQKFPAETSLINVKRTLQLAKQLRDRGAHIVFLSTNQVFDGTCVRPTETSPRSPRTEYGRQKAEVEEALLAAGGATIVRFTKVLSPGMTLFRKWTEHLRRCEPITPFYDLVLAPVTLEFAADVLVRVGQVQVGGVFQVSGDRDVSYADVALRLAGHLDAQATLVCPTSYKTAGLPPEMAPDNTAMCTERLAADLGLRPPTVGQTIQHVFASLAAA